MAYLPLVNLWSKKSLIINFSWINIKIRYKGSYLGLLWTALEPTLIFLLLYTVFTSIREDIREDFGIYLLSGIILYQAFARGTTIGLTSLRMNGNILKSLNIRKEFFPVTSTMTVCITLFVQIVVFFALMPYFNFIPPWTILFLPIVLLLLIILILGLSYLLSIINVYVKDIQLVWGIVVLAMFFVSPIFWYLENVNEKLLFLHSLNPLGQIIELGHKVVISGQIPSLNDLAYVSLLVFIVFFVGIITFQRFEKYSSEEL